MKKYILSLVLVFLFIAACEKIDGGGSLCGCTMLPELAVSFSVRSVNDTDLLNNTNTSYFSSSAIKLWTKKSNGSAVNLTTFVRPPFNYPSGPGSQAKYDFYQLYSTEAVKQYESVNQEYYIQFGNSKVDTLSFDIDRPKRLINKVILNKVQIQRDATLPAGILNGTDIYILRPN